MVNLAPMYICLVAIAVLCASPSTASEQQPTDGSGLHKIDYIRKEIPSVPVVPYGESATPTEFRTRSTSPNVRPWP